MMHDSSARHRPTIHDVAAAAGVSVTTVSHALNGYADVGPSTLERVRRAVYELGYTPRISARGLRLRRTWLIGVLLPAVTTSYFHELLQAIEDAADAAGYGVLLFTSRDDPQREHRTLEVLQEKKEVDGIILASAHVDPGDFRAEVAGIRCPLVLVSPSLGGETAAAIPDPYDGVVAAFQHLLILGHTHVLYLAGRDGAQSWYSQRRDDAVTAMVARGQGRLRVDSVRRCTTTEHGYLATLSYLRQAGTATAVVAYSDAVAAGALRAIYEARLRVPDDISVIGFDDVIAEICVPPLTSVAPPKKELGQAALTLLLEQMDGQPRRSVVLATTLTCRASTGRARLQSQAGLLDAPAGTARGTASTV
jgi:LacI family transcriptional regulator